MKKIAIVQSFYIPWKGYFDLINRVDEFVLYDDAQYVKRSWNNRNRIKTPQGARWLTIPVQVKGRQRQPICQTRVVDDSWSEKHWKSIVRHYQRCRFFEAYRTVFEDLYRSCDERSLSQINVRFIRAVCELLGITTRLTWSMNYTFEGDKTEKLISICRQAGADSYLSGPAAKAYIDEAKFRAAGIDLHYMSYDGYPEYEQPFPPFVHEVSILDLILNTGPRAQQYMLSFQS